MFSVPLSREILAPEEMANHSTGTPISSARSIAAMMRAHSGSATDPSERVGSPSSATRTMPSGCFSVGVRTRPATIPADVPPGGRSTGTSRPVLVEVVLDEGALRSGEQPDELVRVDGAPPPGGQHALGVGVEGRERLGGYLHLADRHPGPGLVREAQGRLAGPARLPVGGGEAAGAPPRARAPRSWARAAARPLSGPAAAGPPWARRRGRRGWPGGAAAAGAPPGPGGCPRGTPTACARPPGARSAPRRRPAPGVRSRTSASATNRSSAGVSRAAQWNR